MEQGGGCSRPLCRYSEKFTGREEMPLDVKSLADKIKPPCAKCPYKLGLVQTLMNPCPQCKLDGYQAYKHFTNKAHSVSGNT